MASSCKEYNACMFSRISDNGRYRVLSTTLDKEHITKKGAYPKTLDVALKLLVNVQTKGYIPRRNVPDWEKSGVYFVQHGKAPEEKGEVNTNRQGKSECFHCGKKDH